MRKAYENRPRNAYGVKKQAEQLLYGLQPLQSTVAKFTLNRMEWLIKNGKKPNFDAKFICNILCKDTELKPTEEEVRLALVQLIDKRLIKVDKLEDGSWQWAYGDRVNEIITNFNEGDREAFFKAFYYRK